MTDDFEKPVRRIVFAAVLGVGLAAGLAFAIQRQLAPAAARPGAPAQEKAGAEKAEPAGPALSDAEQGEVRRGWERSSTLAPRSESLDPATGERVLPFQGFGISVDSAPAGARVLVDGRELGETPLLASVDCRPGAAVEVRLEKPPLPPARRTTTCRRDTLVKLAVPLDR